MTRLILLRHASAVSGANDATRPLSEGGHVEAEGAGRRLVEHGWIPDRVLCSSAVRARQTLDGVTRAVGARMSASHISYDPRLYLASPERLLTCLSELAERARCVLLVAHNPGLFELTRALGGNEERARRALSLGFPPASLALFLLLGGWADVHASSVSLSDVLRPGPSS